jgi:hypothetical protein
MRERAGAAAAAAAAAAELQCHQVESAEHDCAVVRLQQAAVLPGDVPAV